MLNASNNPNETSKAFITNITELMKTMPNPHEDLDPWEKLYEDVKLYDDTNGHKLDQSRAVAAKTLEMQFFKEMTSIRRYQERKRERGDIKS